MEAKYWSAMAYTNFNAFNFRLVLSAISIGVTVGAVLRVLSPCFRGLGLIPSYVVTLKKYFGSCLKWKLWILWETYKYNSHTWSLYIAVRGVDETSDFHVRSFFVRFPASKSKAVCCWNSISPFPNFWWSGLLNLNTETMFTFKVCCH